MVRDVWGWRHVCSLIWNQSGNPLKSNSFTWLKNYITMNVFYYKIQDEHLPHRTGTGRVCGSQSHCTWVLHKCSLAMFIGLVLLIHFIFCTLSLWTALYDFVLETGSHTAQADLELPMWQMMTLNFWSFCLYLPNKYIYVYITTLGFLALSIEPRTLWMLGKYPTNWVIYPGHIVQFQFYTKTKQDVWNTRKSLLQEKN